MNNPEVTLIEPSEALASELLEMASEYRASGDDRYQSALADVSAYLRKLLEHSAGVGLPPGRVPSTTFWLKAGPRIVGRSSLRHHLTPELEEEGGHIGYDIRPSYRRKGYGTLILGMTLKKAKGLGLERVLITCDTDNVESARIIEKNGGRLEARAISGKSGKKISRYWIGL